jgi:hypothetical protein
MALLLRGMALAALTKSPVSATEDELTKVG